MFNRIVLLGVAACIAGACAHEAPVVSTHGPPPRVEPVRTPPIASSPFDDAHATDPPPSNSAPHGSPAATGPANERSAAPSAPASVDPTSLLDLRPGADVALTLHGRERRAFRTPVGRYLLVLTTTGASLVTLRVGQHVLGAKAGDPIDLVVERTAQGDATAITGIAHASVYGFTLDPPPKGVLDLGDDGATLTVTLSLTSVASK